MKHIFHNLWRIKSTDWLGDTCMLHHAPANASMSKVELDADNLCSNTICGNSCKLTKRRDIAVVFSFPKDIFNVFQHVRWRRQVTERCRVANRQRNEILLGIRGEVQVVDQLSDRILGSSGFAGSSHQVIAVRGIVWHGSRLSRAAPALRILENWSAREPTVTFFKSLKIDASCTTLVSATTMAHCLVEILGDGHVWHDEAARQYLIAELALFKHEIIQWNFNRKS